MLQLHPIYHHLVLLVAFLVAVAIVLAISVLTEFEYVLKTPCCSFPDI